MVDDRLVRDVTFPVARVSFAAPRTHEPQAPQTEPPPVLRLLLCVCGAFDLEGGVQVQGGHVAPNFGPPEETDRAAPEEPDLEGEEEGWTV